MKKRWIGYAVWLASAACLYFFENGTGTRVVLVGSLLFPLISPLRSAFLDPDRITAERPRGFTTVRQFVRREENEPGDVRPYLPGDPVRRIHWKLSAKKDELLVRESAPGQEAPEERKQRAVLPDRAKKNARRRIAAGLAVCVPVCLLLLLLVPEANRGARVLCNRLFSASEAVNSYAYVRFDIPESQSVVPATVLLLGAGVFAAAAAAALKSRSVFLGLMAVCSLFQTYFGLAFPAWVNIPLYGLLSAGMLRRPVRRKDFLTCAAYILLVTLAVSLFIPGADPVTEFASERVRDRLSRMAEQLTGTARELPTGLTETRHVHPRSLETGEEEAETGQEFRLVTIEEEQISRPDRINWIKMILYLMLTVALVILPFAPFLLLNARKRKARESREAFASENVSEGIRAVFRRIILWLEAFGFGGGNLPYRSWAPLLPKSLPDGYADRFALCAADFEEAAYSGHEMPEQKRESALKLLEETESALWKAANHRQRFYLKYWMCFRE